MPQMLIYALQVLQALPGLLTAGQNVISLVESTNAAIERMQIENRDPSPAEWQHLNDSLAALRAALKE